MCKLYKIEDEINNSRVKIKINHSDRIKYTSSVLINATIGMELTSHLADQTITEVPETSTLLREEIQDLERT